VRILFIEQFSELGGGQRNLLDLLPAVVERGWKAVVAAPGSGPLFDCARVAGAEAVAIPFSTYANGHKTAGDAARFSLDTMRLAHWISRTDADVISVGGARALPAAALGARGRRVVFQAQHFLSDTRALRVARWAIWKAGATVIANSQHVAKQFGAKHVVYNGVAEIPFVAREFGPTWRIGLIGRIAPMKGQADFLRAAALLNLPNARFILAGAPMFTPQSYVDEVRRLAEGLPVDFLGWRDDVDAVLRELDLLVVPSTAAEATTRVILEAFSAGVPVVAYAAGGIPEIIREGENGFLVPECEPQALARRIQDVATLDLGAIAPRARRDWEQNYTVERYRAEMVALLEKESGVRMEVLTP